VAEGGGTDASLRVDAAGRALLTLMGLFGGLGNLTNLPVNISYNPMQAGALGEEY
jgi:hypothetical protein